MLSGSLLMLVLGLNLIVMKYVLKVSGAVPDAARCGLAKNGAILAFLGIVVWGLGIAMWGYNWQLHLNDWSDITKVGAAILGIGASLIVRTYGRRHERIVNSGAWAAVGIGILLFLANFVIPYVVKSPGTSG